MLKPNSKVPATNDLDLVPQERMDDDVCLISTVLICQRSQKGTTHCSSQTLRRQAGIFNDNGNKRTFPRIGMCAARENGTVSLSWASFRTTKDTWNEEQ